jgi:hypothetical protein
VLRNFSARPICRHFLAVGRKGWVHEQKKSIEKKPLIFVGNPEALKPTLKQLGGSQSDNWNLILVNQALNALWLNPNQEVQEQQRSGMAAALVGIGPKDELEGMMATQLIAAHSAAMECYRRAMLKEQTFEGRRENLNQANKLSRTYATLLEALNRHRGKGQQKVTVEHVHVHAGGQAVVGLVETPGGSNAKSEDQPHARQIAHAPQSSMRGQDEERKSVPVTGDAERSVPNARRKVAGCSKGK